MVFRWSYDSVRRYFKDLPGVLVKDQPRRYKRPYRGYRIPHSVLQREWEKMARFNSPSGNVRSGSTVLSTSLGQSRLRLRLVMTVGTAGIGYKRSPSGY